MSEDSTTIQPTTTTEAAPAAADAPAPPTPPNLWTRLGPAALLGLAWAVMPGIMGFVIFFGVRAEVADWFASHSLPLALTLYIAAFILAAGLGLLPTWAQATIGGYAFGMWGGFFGALAGFTGASILGYAIARAVALRRVDAEMATNAKARAVRDELVGKGPWRTFATVALLRFPPNSPFALMNLALAATRVPLGTYIAGTAVGMAPRTLAYAWIGTTVQDWDQAGVPKWMTIAGVISALVVLGILGHLANKAVERVKRGYASVSSA